ncbi:glycosyltransferase [Nocardioides sp. LS1]|uniref:glycosyltransferase family 2 protein n=1 Tax=Nocardioides sp. LS1 TaxID=1027620 RepID=UPI000F61E8B6|nr:glycosyltransferase [Nocardioides sp. LS1]GCD90890.1 glycosyl transferase [Nocardioides sp. LS1]
MSPPRVRTAIDQVQVVIPAHDEEGLLPRCLASVRRAADHLAEVRPGVRVGITVVADCCTDRTVEIATGWPATQVVVSRAGNVGAARRAGVDHVVRHTLATPPELVWLAHTDADSVVPEHWLAAQLMLADAGFAMVVGTVVPARTDLPPHIWDQWRARHHLGEGHPHVHGANLGLTLHASQVAGGFQPAPAHEDVSLVAAVRSAGLPWCATAATQVTTSGRQQGRVASGFARYLARLSSPTTRVEVPGVRALSR